jgi:protein-S-isoprenylcysteine O-methyltransferase Ste14
MKYLRPIGWMWADKIFACALVVVAWWRTQHVSTNLAGYLPVAVAVMIALYVLRADKKQSTPPSWRGVLGVFVTYLSVFFYQATLEGTGNRFGVCFTAVILFYLALAVWGYCALDKSFAILPDARTVVFRGPYEIVRHPIYSAYLHMALCYLAFSFSPSSIAATTIFYLGISLRVKDEENLLSESVDYRRLATTVRARFFNPAISAPAALAIASEVARKI